MRVIVLLLALTATAAPIAHPAIAEEPPRISGPQADVEAIFDVVARWSAARDAGDVEGVVAAHSDDVLIMTRNRAVYRGAEGVRNFYRDSYGEPGQRRLLGDMMELTVSGDLATMVGRFLVIEEAAAKDGEELREGGYYLIVFRREADGWKAWRDIDTPSPDGLALESASSL